MNLNLNEEQVSLQDTVRALLDDKFPTPALRACEIAPEKAREIYAELFALGLGGIIAPDDAGGMALGLTDMVVTQVEMGAALTPLLFTESTVLVARLLAASEEPAARAALSTLIAGETLATCAWEAPADEAEGQLRLGPDGLTGAAGFVPEVKLADWILVRAANDSGSPLLCLVARDAAGLTITDLPNLVELDMALLDFSGAPVHAIVARGDAADAAWRDGLSVMRVAVAAQAVGGAARALEMARDYAGTRQQFGQPIGSFQAIAHMLADGAVNVEGARMLVYRAAAAADDGEALDTWADLAKLKACQVYRDVSAMAIQVHGGIGFTLEADPQLFYRRAKHLQLMYGSVLDLQERAGDALIAGTHKVLEA